MEFNGSTILVLGASGQLGSRIATRLAQSGAKVIGTSHSEHSIDSIPAVAAEKHIVDLTFTHLCSDFVSKIKATHSSLDGIVIASGRVGFASVADLNKPNADELMAINYTGPAHIISGLSSLLQGHTADKAFVAGITGVVVEQTFPGMAAYTASKVALSSYLQTIEKEWRRYKIFTTDIRLGHTETGLSSRPLYGAAPQMPTGLNPDRAVDLILQSIADEKRIVPSSDFVA